MLSEEASDPSIEGFLNIQKHSAIEQPTIYVKTPLICKIGKGGYCWVERAKAWLTWI